ncbi:MAG: triple tyrosine motif-containing protein [Haliea sp.]|uniref:triple tyrosine motif-containing protein n=1 Tax=Haliea sp. TaxID=1932666 RepID=UPI0032EBE3FC
MSIGKPPRLLIFFLLFHAANCIAALESANKPDGRESWTQRKQPSFAVVDSFFNRFLHQGTTLSILHTTNNSLWASNYGGVLEAKGKHIEHHNQSSETGQLRIVELVEVWNGEVIARTESSSLMFFDANTGLFNSPRWMRSLGIGNSNISKVYFSNDESLWIGFDNGDVVKVGNSGTKKERISLDLDEAISDFSENRRAGNILISGSTKVARTNRSLDNIEVFEIESSCLRQSRILEVMESDDRTIWIGTSGEGLLTIDENSGECNQVTPSAFSHRGLPKSTVHELVIHDESGLFVVATDQGIYIFRERQIVDFFTTSNSYLSNNEVICLSPDHLGGYWIGTYDGINRLVISSFDTFGRHDDRKLHSVVEIESLDQSNLLIASYSGLMVVSKLAGEVSSLTDFFPGTSVVGEGIMSAFVDKERVYLGYRNSGFEIVNVKKPGSILFNSDSLEGLRSDSISAFLRLNSDELLVGTYGGGISIFNESGRARNILPATENYTLPDDRILMLFRTLDDRIWIGTESGLRIFDKESGELYSPKFSPSKLAEPEQPLIWSMAESSRYIWFGSLHHGLFKLDKSIEEGQSLHQKIQQVALDSHLPNLTVYAIEVGGDGEIWFSTNQGISRLSEDGSLFNFGQAQGLQKTEFELGSSHTDAEGLIYFGGNDGYVRFDPRTIQIIKTTSDVVLTQLIIGNKKPEPRGLAGNLDSIILSHEDRFITFEFSALDFTDPENTRYRHKLVGFDTEWVDIGNRGSATYTSLPAGEYVFRVQAVNSSGIWNYEGLSIDLTVKPAPWLTPWAFAAYFIVICALLAIGLWFYRKQLLRTQQLNRVTELHQMVDSFADSLQDQWEFQAKFTDSIHTYNKQLLSWARFCTGATLEWESTVNKLAHDRMRFRLGVLELIQDSLYYRGEKLYSNLKSYTAKLVEMVGANHPQVLSRLTAVNDIQDELFPAVQAIPLAIIMAELFDNSLTHAFAGNRAACFVRFSVTVTAVPESGRDTVKLVYQDDGCGIPEGLGFNAGESAGFTIIQHAAEELGCKLAIAAQDRNTVTAQFDVPWA